MRKLSFLMVVALVLMLSVTAAAQDDKVTIDFWHAMGGHNLEVTETLVERFNEQHEDIEVVA